MLLISLSQLSDCVCIDIATLVNSKILEKFRKTAFFPKISAVQKNSFEVVYHLSWLKILLECDCIPCTCQCVSMILQKYSKLTGKCVILAYLILLFHVRSTAAPKPGVKEKQKIFSKICVCNLTRIIRTLQLIWLLRCLCKNIGFNIRGRI